MENFAAGIVPYTSINGIDYFLLGMEKSNKKWSGFVGGSEPGETPVKTALREFHEETAMVFKNLNDYIKIELENKLPIVDKTTTGKTVYIWFIHFPVYTLFMDFSNFYNVIFTTTKSEYKEKSELWWFNRREIDSAVVLYKLKKMIHRFQTG